MIDIVWLGPVSFIPGVDCLTLVVDCCLPFVDTVFIRLSALTVYLQFLQVDRQCDLALPPSSLAFSVLPLGCLFRFAHCSVVWSRLFQTFAFLSYLDICWGAPGDVQVCLFLLLVPVSFLFHFVAKSEFPSHPLPRSFLATSLSDFAAGLSVASFICPVRP